MNDEIKKKSFLVYYDNEVFVLMLSDDEAGKLFKSLFPYGREKIKPDFNTNPALAMAFNIISMAMDRDEEKYLRRCEANRKNGRRGGLAKASNSKQSLANGKQGLANLADKDMDKDKDNSITYPEAEVAEDLSTNGIPECNQMETQYSIDKDRIDKDSIDNTICTEPDKPAPDLSGVLLPLNDNTYYDVPKESISKWRDTYPAVDVEQQLKQMTAWLDANPRRRKTRRGINAFINSWLAREQDRGGVYRNGGSRQQESAPASNELPQEYKEMYAKYLGKNPPDPDAPFQ